MDLDPVLLEVLEAAQVRQRLVQQLALADDDAGLMHRDRRRGVDPIEDERVGDLLDVVEDVVERADQAMDLLAVERRDEGPLEAAADVVADLVAAMLDVADLARSPFDGVVRPEERL